QLRVRRRNALGDGRGRSRFQRRAFFRRRALARAHPRRRRADACRSYCVRRWAMSGAAIPAWRRQSYSLAALRHLARGALPRPIFDFADGGAEDERTLRRNESAFGDIALIPRPLNGAATRDISVELFGA